jgi:Holliday junction resolvase RusA-like endonuclease
MTLVNIVDQNHDKLKAWREEIGQVAKILMGGRPLFTGPIFFGVDFYFARPKSHYDKRGVRSGTPKFHTNIPDSSKVLRAVEDALTGVVWTDDKLIAESHQRKLYAEEDRVVVKVMVLT